MPTATRPAGVIGDSYAIEELSFIDREAIRALALAFVIERALIDGIGSNKESLTVHNIRPDADMNAGAVAYEQWLTGALVASTEYTFVNDTQLDIRKVLVIYGGFIDEPNPSPSEFRFRQNTGGTVPLYFINVQHVRANQVNKWVMAELVVYDQQDIMNITIIPSVTDAGGQVVGFLGYVAEPKGRPFSGPVA